MLDATYTTYDFQSIFTLNFVKKITTTLKNLSSLKGSTIQKTNKFST
jgi:hypothetical protein